ncbi:MAG: HlyC/CorC family transporter [Deltaproteobacteria bacterium]|nr:HlyC/CorC family transporter [Deltaproteobacteria bacterium]
MIFDLLLLLICILGSGFSSGSEIALVTASRTRFQRLASDGVRGANRTLGLIEEKHETLAVILIATNVFNISCGAIGTVIFQEWIGSMGPVVATVVITSVLLVISEIVPKALFLYHADNILVRTSIYWKSITAPIDVVTKVLSRVLGNEDIGPYSATRDEIKLLLEESAESGGLKQYEQEMLESTLNYALDLVREHGHTRIPVYRGRIDQIVGFLNIFDVFYDKQRKTYIRPYIRPARLVPETKQIDELFLEMQRQSESLAVAVNEFGACFGIVTLEDIMEEIFGELVDEHEDLKPEIQEKGPGWFHVDGRADIDDLRYQTGIEIDKAGFETVAGYVLYRFGKIPQKGESFDDGDLSVKVLEADRYSVKSVEMVRRESEED